MTENIEIHSKSAKVPARSAAKTILEEGWFQDHSNKSRPGIFWQAFGATWEILGAAWAQAGRPWGPKSSILALGCFKMSKNEAPERMPKNIMFFYGLFVGKWEVLKAPGLPKCFIYKHFGGFR